MTYIGHQWDILKPKIEYGARVTKLTLRTAPFRSLAKFVLEQMLVHMSGFAVEHRQTIVQGKFNANISVSEWFLEQFFVA